MIKTVKYNPFGRKTFTVVHRTSPDNETQLENPPPLIQPPTHQEPTYILSTEQQTAIDLFRQQKNIFVTGPGGTGKTLLIKEFVNTAKAMQKTIQVCAMTGCASVLLGTGARTIHSWSGIKLAKGPAEKIIQNVLKNRNAKKSWVSTDILVIDEVSMMSQKIFEILEETARRIRRSSKFFGGIQVVFSGDFYQLGPIGDPLEPETTQYCFESPKWFQVFPKENHIKLHTIFRQNDTKYIEILDEIRQGTLSQTNIELLNTYIKRPYDPTQHNNCYLTKLFPIKSRVDYINQLMFDEITEPIQEYTMITATNLTTYIDNGTGKPIEPEILEKCDNMTPDEQNQEIERIIGTSTLQKSLQLKKGAAVMCLTNLAIEKGICNGSQGIVVEFIGTAPKVKFANGQIETIPLHYIQSEEYPRLAIGQYPLCLAWAMTIHKMQGATLDMGQVDIGNAIFEYGQTYVALSRIRSLDGLYLSDFKPHRIKANPKVREFYASF